MSQTIGNLKSVLKYFAKTKPISRMNTKLGLVETLMVLGVVLLLSSCCAGLPLQDQQKLNNRFEVMSLNQYAIGIDAGSKGTRVYLYNYIYTNDPSSTTNNMVMNQLLFCRLTDNAGLGSYTFETVGRVGSDLDECLDQADELVPKDKKNSTYVALGATAGMRLAEIRNKALSDRIMSEIRAHLKARGYFYNDQASDKEPVRILSGQEEGLFAWAASNYLDNQFTKEETDVPGIFDLGGSSAQISFSLNDDTYLNNENTVKKTFNSREYNLYSHSNLCYGTAAALNFYKTYLLRNKNYEPPAKAHCMPEGYDFEMAGQEMLDSPCTNGAIFDDSHAFIPETSKINANSTYRFLGASNNKNKCPEQISLITPKLDQSLPSTKGKSFFALGNYFEAFDYTQSLFGLESYQDMNEFKSLTLQMCNMKYADLLALRKKNNASVSKNRTGLLCMENMFIIELLSQYGITDFNQLTPLEYSGENLVNWVLGFLIVELNERLN